MSFKWNFNDNKLVNVNNKYKQLVKAFCQEYYKIYDDDIKKLNKFYKTESKFTYLDEEFIGFENFCDKIKCNDIRKIIHHDIHATGQPVNEFAMLLNVTGNMSFHNKQNGENKFKFSETILLQRDNENKFSISNTIFKIID